MWQSRAEVSLCSWLAYQRGCKEMTDANHMICYISRLSWDGKRKGRKIIWIYLENPFPDNLERGALRTTTFLAATGATAHWEVHIVNIVHLWIWHTQNPYSTHWGEKALRSTHCEHCSFVTMTHTKSLQHTLGREGTEKYTLWTLFICEHDCFDTQKSFTAHTRARRHWEVHIVNIVHLWIWHTQNPYSTHWGEKALRSIHCEHCSFVNMTVLTHKNPLQHTLGREGTEKYTLWTLLIQEYDANEITHPKILTAHTAVTTNWEVHTENMTHWEHCKFKNVTDTNEITNKKT